MRRRTIIGSLAKEQDVGSGEHKIQALDKSPVGWCYKYGKGDRVKAGDCLGKGFYYYRDCFGKGFYYYQSPTLYVSSPHFYSTVLQFYADLESESCNCKFTLMPSLFISFGTALCFLRNLIFDIDFKEIIKNC